MDLSLFVASAPSGAIPMTYVELHARSAFSFLRGGSLPDVLVAEAARLGIPAVAMTDRMGLQGVPRFHRAGREAGVRGIVGAELAMEDGSVLPVLVENRTGYQNLCRCLTQAHLRSAKGTGTVRWDELPEFASGLVALTGDEEGPLRRALLGARNAASGGEQAGRVLDRLAAAFGASGVFVELQRHHLPGESRWNRVLIDLARSHRLPLLATQAVSHATPGERPVVDVFTCLRHHVTLDAAGARLSSNAERHLKDSEAMGALFADLPEAVSNTMDLAARLRFELSDLGYEFPRFPVGPDETMEAVLEDWAYRGARQCYGGRIPDKVERLLIKELTLIHRLGFDGYFLIVADLIRYCRDHGILAQGRGSAANSAVCFCLGVTAVDPVRFDVLFERFLSESRKGWPDIDIDLPSGAQREQVIQEVYRRYGPHGAAMTGTIITYRGRNTARELGKVLGLPMDVVDRFNALFSGGDFPHTLEFEAQLEKAGLPASHPRVPAFAALYRQISGLPRHLGQHSGGMIVARDPLNQLVPLENASMPGRVVAQWDKDDCEDLGIIKIDLLGLGMMAALQDTVALCAQRGNPVDLARLPENDPATFELMRRADTVGVFQIESRAQMATLPRMRPERFYDLVIEIAIIRPGPIEGGLAHPYLARRNGEEPVTYFGGDERLKPILGRTLGVPLFQEQMLAMAMVMANFSGSEAEELRRALSFHRSNEKMSRATAKLRAAMDRSGVDPRVAEQIVDAVGSFALYGFPESHAISFAHLAYASAYLKTHRASEFYCALLNNQPMGFYSPATLVRDARKHGVPVRPVSLQKSEWSCGVEADGALRLGFRQVQGLRHEAVLRLVAERTRAPFRSLDDLRRRVPLRAEELRQLAALGVLNDLAPHRRAALWEVERRRGDDLLEATGASSEGQRPVPLAPMTPMERMGADYSGMRLTTGPHPMALIRDRFPDLWRAEDLSSARDRERVWVGGQVICRQRPGTAKGVCFVSLEDETGITNVIVSPTQFEVERLTLTQEPFLAVLGEVQRRGATLHVKAHRIERLEATPMVFPASHDFG